MLPQQAECNYSLPVDNLVSKIKAMDTSSDPERLLAILQGSQSGDIAGDKAPRYSPNYFTAPPPSSARRKTGQRDHSQQTSHPCLPNMMPQVPFRWSKLRYKGLERQEQSRDSMGCLPTHTLEQGFPVNFLRQAVTHRVHRLTSRS